MKANSPKPPGYESKSSDYFEQARSEMLQFVPATCKRVLDVGCSKGNFGKLLKQSRPIEVWGIEPVATAAAEAATKLDHVIEGMFTPEADLPMESFDAIFFNDVLEHVYDPAAALKFALKLLRPGGIVIASIPNIRHLPILWALVFKGRWDYTEWGILDKTHLRFFTKKNIVELFADSGFKVEQIDGINPNLGGSSKKWFAFNFINRLTFSAIEDMRFLQFAVVARPLKDV